MHILRLRLQDNPRRLVQRHFCMCTHSLWNEKADVPSKRSSMLNHARGALRTRTITHFFLNHAPPIVA